MAHKSENLNTSASQPTDRIQELSWALFDDSISANEMGELESMLTSDTAARNVYIECAQLHADLTTFYAAQRPAKNDANSKTPVLGFLADAMPILGTPTTDTVQ